jgi:polar amino acid transport system substrate-binding protein
MAPRTLKVGAALPDPPFEWMDGNDPTGFDIALMQRIARHLGREWELVRYEGADFNGIFAGLDSGAYDCIASGTTITPEREQVADFCQPYVLSGQSLVVDAVRLPNVRSIDDLNCLTIGVQRGRASLWLTGWWLSTVRRACGFMPTTKSKWLLRT